jgi:hypothetical protein
MKIFYSTKQNKEIYDFCGQFGYSEIEIHNALYRCLEKDEVGLNGLDKILNNIDFVRDYYSNSPKNSITRLFLEDMKKEFGLYGLIMAIKNHNLKEQPNYEKIYWKIKNDVGLRNFTKFIRNSKIRTDSQVELIDL